MEFEYDPVKSASNFEKHGIDFEEAQELWSGETLQLPVEFKGERRTMVIGRLGGEYWIAVCTQRGEKTRIISVRRATDRERSSYDREVYNR